MTVISAKLRFSVHLGGPDSEPTSVTVGGKYDPDTDTFTYFSLDRGGRENVVPNAASMLVPEEPAEGEAEMPASD